LEAKEDGVYQQVPLVSNMKNVSINQKQFIQSVVDRMKSRFCSDSNSENAQLLQDISVLELSTISTAKCATVKVRLGEFADVFVLIKSQLFM
jgi:hypothetical protein